MIRAINVIEINSGRILDCTTFAATKDGRAEAEAYFSNVALEVFSIVTPETIAKAIHVGQLSVGSNPSYSLNFIGSAVEQQGIKDE